MVSRAAAIAREGRRDRRAGRHSRRTVSGTTDWTVGGVVSGSRPVVKLQTYPDARLLPARSSIPIVGTCRCTSC